MLILDRKVQTLRLNRACRYGFGGRRRARAANDYRKRDALPAGRVPSGIIYRRDNRKACPDSSASRESVARDMGGCNAELAFTSSVGTFALCPRGNRVTPLWVTMGRRFMNREPAGDAA